MTVSALVLWAAGLGFAASASAPPETATLEERDRLIQQHYQDAFESFRKGEYAKAVERWNEILRIDPYQTAASDLIEQARKKIEAQNAGRDAELKRALAAGEYRKATGVLEKMLGDDPTNRRLRDLQVRASRLGAKLKTLPGDSRSAALARQALSGFVLGEGDAQAGYNALRYASELEPGLPGLASAVALYEGEHAELARLDRVPKGSGLLDHKRKVALQQIYAGHYDRAVELCREILALEPKDATALKRLGSAHYAKGRLEEAREAWSKAYEVSPDDRQLKGLLDGLERKLKDRKTQASTETRKGP